MSKENNDKQEEKRVISLRFIDHVERQFTAEMGSKLQFTEYEKTLAQHLFLKTDQSLKKFEDDRLSSRNPNSRTPFNWNTINRAKLALDAVHRIALGLDALLPNHIHPIPYYNSKTGKYDLDLRIGYEGKDYYRREMAVEKPLDIIYELVHETDVFIPIKKSIESEIDTYKFQIKKPFNRGSVIGGFGYIMHEDPTKNKLVIVPDTEFKKAREYAKTDEFWGKHPDRMKYKVLVHRTTEKLQVDPRKINTNSYAYVEGQETEIMIQNDIDENANTIDIDLDLESATEPDNSTEEKTSEPEDNKKPDKDDTDKEVKEEVKEEVKPETNKKEKQEKEQMKLAMSGADIEEPEF